MNNLVGNTCWISILLLLWGMVTKIIPSHPISWFAFVFFCLMGLFAFIITRNGK